MSVAVIVPVFNRGTTVLEALDGVAAQTCPPRQLIVVDDGSTDDTAATVRGWLESRTQPFATELICQKNLGVSAARNRGLRNVSGCRYVAFLDSDDVWPADFLERACRVLDADPRAIAATADRFYEHRTKGTTRQVEMEAIGRDAVRFMMVRDGGVASATLFVLQAIIARGGFDETLRTGEDLALFLPLSLDGLWLHVPGLPVNYRQGLTQERQEAGNLSVSFADNHRRWARVYEEFVGQHSGHPRLPDSLCSQVLSKRWYRAGRELITVGKTVEARECFRRSIQWRFLNKAWLRVAASYFRRAA